MTRKEAIILYSAIKDLRSGDMGKALMSYAQFRVKLRKLMAEFEAVQEEFKAVSKPEGDAEKTKNYNKDWEKAFEKLIEPWLDEDSQIENVKIFTFEQAVNFCTHNDAPGWIQDEVIRLMVEDNEER